VNELLSQMKEVDLKLMRMVAIYVLVYKDEIVYVGQTRDPGTRIRTHLRGTATKKRKRFHRAFLIEVPARQAAAYEGALIRRFAPKYNTTAPGSMWDDEKILARLGLAKNEQARRLMFRRRQKVLSRRRQTRSRSRFRRILLRAAIRTAQQVELERAS